MIRSYYIRFIALIGILSFIFHFVWEWYQCGPFFTHRAAQATPSSMIAAAVGDVVLTYLILSLVYILENLSQSYIPEFPHVKKLVYLEATAFLVALVIEKFALATDRWSYTNINPIIPIFAVSVLPVLQLMLLTPVILFLATRISIKLRNKKLR